MLGNDGTRMKIYSASRGVMEMESERMNRI